MGLHNIKTLFCSDIKETRDFLRTILQIAVHDHDPLTGCMIESGQNCHMLTNVRLKVYATHTKIDSCETDDNIPGLVRTRIVHHYDFEIIADRGKRRRQAVIEFLETACPIDWDHD